MATSIETKYEIPGEVGLAEVEGELRRLWDEAVDNARVDGQDERSTRQRVCTLTLIAAGVPETVVNSVLEKLAPAMSQHPSRTIIVSKEEGETGAHADVGKRVLSASISAYCRAVEEGRPQVCSEDIIIHDRGASRSELQSGLALLAAPNLPVFLWWVTDPVPVADTLHTLSELTDRTILDTSASSAPAEGIKMAWDLAQDDSYDVEDLAWGRAMVWRSALAQLFDPPEFRPLMARISRVEIEYGEAAGSQALMYVGWLGSRLGWKSFGKIEQANGISVCRFKGIGEREVEVRLHEVPEFDVDPGHLVSVQVGCEGDWRFSLTRSSAGDCAVARVEPPEAEQTHHIIPLDLSGVSTLISKSLGHRTQDEVYEEALGVTFRMISD